MPFVKFEDQLADIFTKGLGNKSLYPIVFKLGMIDIFAPTLRGVLSYGWNCNLCIMSRLFTFPHVISLMLWIYCNFFFIVFFPFLLLYIFYVMRRKPNFLLPHNQTLHGIRAGDLVP